MPTIKTMTIGLAILIGCASIAAGMTRQVYNRDGSIYCEQCQSTNSHSQHLPQQQYEYIKTYVPAQHKTAPSIDIAPPYITSNTQQRVVNSVTSDSAPQCTSSNGNCGTKLADSSSSSSSSSISSTSQGCSRNPCGVNAMCQETLGGRPVCSCPPGHSGNPLNYCRRAECLDHTECRNDQSCRNGNCINPCSGTCGVNANCEVRNHVAVCSCPAGYGGDPFSVCRVSDPEELCHPSPCGVNTRCQVLNGVPTCTCLPGYTGNPLSGCRHECDSDNDCGAQDYCKDFKCVSACTQCGQGAQCNRLQNHRSVCECPKGYIGSPYTECRPECYGDSDCPAGRPACYYGICKNPCDGSCGIRADCNLRGLTPVCSCPRDMTGDPFVSCRPFTKEDLCSPNPCGTNAICTPGHDNTGKERPVCTCSPGYTGNSLVHCLRGECQSDSECSDNRACINYSCVDPCLGQCGVGAICEPKRHLAVCKCPQGTTGDALISCRQSRSYPVARYNKKREITLEGNIVVDSNEKENKTKIAE